MSLNLKNLFRKESNNTGRGVPENTAACPGGGGCPEPPKMYDKDGNELKMPEMPENHGGQGSGKGPGGPGGHGPGGHGGRGEPPKMYDKDGNEVTGRPEKGVAYYDKDGNELKMPENPERPQ